MADGRDPIPASSVSDGRWKIAWVPDPTGSVNPLSLATLKGGTSVPMTYSFTPDGFNPNRAQASIDDKRYTLPQDLNKGGKVTDSLATKYVDSVDPKSAAVNLTAGTDGYFVGRRGVDNVKDWAVGDIVTVWPVTTGVQRDAPGAENGVDLIEQDMYFRNVTQRKVALVA